MRFHTFGFYFESTDSRKIIPKVHVVIKLSAFRLACRFVQNDATKTFGDYVFTGQYK